MANITQVKAVSTTSQFGNAPYATPPPAQGVIRLYTDSGCNVPLADGGPLIVGTCFNMPEPGIKAVSIVMPPPCPNFGNALLVVSDQADCEVSQSGTSANSGQVDVCQTYGSGYSTGVDVKSVQFVCYGKGFTTVPRSTTTSA